MISLNTLNGLIQNKLNTIKGEDVFRIYADGDRYITPYVKNNTIRDDYIQGISTLISSSIIPTNGILIETFIVNTEIVMPIDTDMAAEINEETESITFTEQTFNQVVAPFRNVISMLATDTYKETINEGERTFVVTYTVSQPKAGHITYRDGIGYSLPFSFTSNFAVIQNGINSRDVSILFDTGAVESGTSVPIYENVPFTQVNLIRSPIMDGGAFSGTNGVAKNFMSVSAMQITLSLPALTDSVITSEHLDFILTGQPKIYSIKVKIGTKENTYKMQFGDCNAAAKELDNVGQSIVLVESLEV